MKLIPFIAFFFTPLAFAQELVAKTKFDSIQYVEDLQWVDNDIYCAGYTFQTKINDGNATDAFLINYDAALKIKWTLKVSEEHTNIIYVTKRYKDKLYALVTQGTTTPSTQDVHISLFVISLDGKIEEKIPLGKTFHSPSNIVFDGDNLIFGNKVSNGINYASSSKSEIVKYNLITKKITRFKSSQYLARPKKILAENSNIFLFGIYLHQNQPNIMAYKKGKYSEIRLNPGKEEYYIDSYLTKNILTVVCVFPGVYGDLKKHFKLYYININDNTVKSKIFTYEAMGWSEVRFDSFTADGGSWFITQDNQTKRLNYVLVDHTGAIKKTVKFNEASGNGYWERFIFKDGKLLNANSKGIELFTIE